MRGVAMVCLLLAGACATASKWDRISTWSIYLARAQTTGGTKLAGSPVELPAGSIVCVDVDGKPYLLEKTRVVLPQDWRYAPLVIHGRRVPFCEAGEDSVAVKQSVGAGGGLIGGLPTIPLPPDLADVMRRRNIAHVAISFTVSVSETGDAVMAQWLAPKNPSAATVAHYRQRVAAWRYQPFLIGGQPVAFVTPVIYVYNVER